MASDTVPAVPPQPPHDPAVGATGAGIPNLPGGPAQPAGQDGGWLGGLLTAVDPARPTFDLNPATPPAGDGHADGATLLPQGTSSADFHGQNDPTAGTSGTNSSSGQEKGIWRAWLLAGAERWRKGADARNKMLDIQKAKATALQVKESRTVNRSEKIVGGNTGTNASNNQAKSLNNKTSAAKKDHAGGSKTNGNGGSGGGRSGAGSHSGHGSSGGGRHGASGSGTGGKHTPKTDHGKGAPGTKSAGSGSGGGAGKAGKDGAPGKTGKDTKAHQSNSTSGKSPKPQTTTTCGDASGISMTKDNKPKPEKTKGADTTPGGTSGGGKNPPAGPAGKGDGAPGGTGGSAGAGKTPTPGSGTKPVDPGKKNPDTKGGAKNTPAKPGAPTPDLKKTPAKPDPKTTTPAQAPAAPGPKVNTQPSREAGYRDGTRLGKAEAHVQAWRDGVRDGRNDIKEAADKEKKRLDQAHARRKQQPPAPAVPAPTMPAAPAKPAIPPKPTTPPPTPDPRTILMKPKEQPVTATAPTQTGPTPVKVDHIDATHLRLGEGAARQYISRGEVRTLKQFERRLEARATAMMKVAERTKSLHAEAVEKATKAARLQEAAKAVKGGEKVAVALLRLQENAQIQALKAQELHRRALRAADNTRALLANAKTRYEPLYRAVVDSPETSPAETAFYLGDARV